MSTVRFDGVNSKTAERGFSLPAPAAAVNLPRLEPCAPWLYGHYATCWVVLGNELVPDLHKISLQPGVNDAGQEYDDTGAGVPNGAVNAAQRRGAHVFTDTTLSGELDEPYLRRVRARKGYVWLEHCAEPLAGSMQVKIDDAKRLHMLRTMRDMVQPPEPHIIEAAIDRCERDHAAAFADADRNPIQKRAADRLAAELEVWRAALEQGTPTPKLPTKNKTRRRTPSKPAEEAP